MSSIVSAITSVLADGPVGIVMKATIVLAGAGSCALLLRGASAAIRHLVWLIALVACVGLVALSPAAPTIAVELPTPITSVTVRPDNMQAADVSILSATTPVVVVSGSEPRPSATELIVDEPHLALRRIASLSSLSAVLPMLVVTVWLFGCLLILARCLVGHRHITRIVEGAAPLTSAHWRSALESAAVDVRLIRSVELFASEAISAPVTSGFVRPIVILPIASAEWSAERRHIVLVHELAHVARFDYVTQLVATLTCALFWFHPAVWLAAARLRAEAEHAADDRVLEAGTLGLTYATHLLELARGDGGAQLSPAVAVGMIRSSRLEGRFRAMLDSTRSRAAVSPRLQAAAASLALCAMVPLAGMRAVTPEHTLPALTAEPATLVGPAAVAVSGPVEAVSAEPSALAGPARTVVQESSSRAATTTRSAADSTFEKTIDASVGDRLVLDLRTGGSIILHGWDESRVRLVGRLGGRDWRDTRVVLERTPDGVRLRSDFAIRLDNQSSAHEFELWVPRRINVTLSSAGGSLAINGLSGEFSGNTGGGGITILGATGYASLSTGGGTVTVTNSTLSGTVSTGSGEIMLSNVSGGLRGTSGNGSVIAGGAVGTTGSGGRGGFGAGGSGSTVAGGSGGRTTVSGSATSSGGGYGYGRERASSTTSTTITGSGGRMVTTTYPGSIASTPGRGDSYGSALTISKAGGEIILDSAPDGARLHTGGGRIVVGSAGRTIDASTGGGDVTLERVTGDAFVSTGAGDVRVTVVNTNGPEHSVEVFSGKGRVVLELPANLDARVELETAYTQNFDRRTTISSEFSLEQSETNEWDDRFGTPRKFVRARGTFGNGSGLIRVRVVNGDVVVRRVNR